MDFQMQQMTSAFVEHFGFNGDKFGEQEEKVSASFDRMASITFSLSADDESPSASLFELCCKERLRQFDEGPGSGYSDGEDAMWQDGWRGWARSVRSGGSTDSEEEEEGEVRETMGGLVPPFFSFSNPEPPGTPPQGLRKQILSSSVDSSLGPPGSPDPPCGRATRGAGAPSDRPKDPAPATAAGTLQESTNASVVACCCQAAARQTATPLSVTRVFPKPPCQDSELPGLPSGPAPGGPPPSPNTK